MSVVEYIAIVIAIELHINVNKRVFKKYIAIQHSSVLFKQKVFYFIPFESMCLTFCSDINAI